MTTELDAVRDVRPLVAAPSDGARSAAMQRLTAAIADEPAVLYERRRPTRTRPGLRARLARALTPRGHGDVGARSTGDELREPRRRRSVAARGVLVPVASVLVTAAVVAVVVLTGHHDAGTSSATGPHARSVTLIYRAYPTQKRLQARLSAVERTVSVIRSRAWQLGISRVQIHTRGADEIVVRLAGVRYLARVENVLGSEAPSEFYDWEASVLLPSGKSAASQLPRQNPSAAKLSQGTSAAGPGTPTAGGMSLYDAVKLASGQSRAGSNSALSRLGDEYYLFGPARPSACAAAAHAAGTVPTAGQPCYLAGPEPTIKKLRSEALTNGVKFSDGHTLGVPQGWLVLQAANPKPPPVVSPTNSPARFFVVRDDPALSGRQILSAKPIGLNNGQADLQIRFTATGAQKFQELTSTLAHRGQQVSTTNTVLYQHFAVELGGQLLTVLPIDYTKYPDGVVSTADLQGPFTAASARTLATELTQFLPIPIQLIDMPRAAG
jgi:hypothetical protein